MEIEHSGRVINLHETHRPDGKKTLYVNNEIHTNKYHIWSFIFVNLFEQFSRIANFYFLIIISLLQFPWAPISAAVAVTPLIIVIGISAIREAIEDFLRYRSDIKANAEIAHVLQNGQFTNTEWGKILVGNVIRVNRGEPSPADIIVLASSSDDGAAYIDTCNLDGETNLKLRQSFQTTSKIEEPGFYQNMHMRISCDQPNNTLYTFNGNIEYEGTVTSLDNKNLILRGCVLKNTDWVIGAVVYSGHDTKIMKNSSKARFKRSLLERGLNKKLIFIFCLIFIFAFLQTGMGYYFEQKQVNSGNIWYFYRKSMPRHKIGSFFILLVCNIVIINTMVPISLYVTLEVVRVFQGLFVNWDAAMFDNGVGAEARTTTISDDLGQIDYVFSDKTGTLTRNVMEFMMCSIGGKRYGEGTTEVAYAAALRRGLHIAPPTGEPFHDSSLQRKMDDPTVIKFMQLLSLCHSVVAEQDETAKHGVRFEASSPDEAALVSAAADLGYIFRGRRPGFIELEANGQRIEVENLVTLEFSSERKRSSVIVRLDDKIILFCKGSDDLIFERLSEDSPFKRETKAHLKEFASNGLRTLCCAYREIDEDYYEEWIKMFDEANCAIDDRDSKIDRAANEIESNLQLLGATAIEDKLQEGVSDTISALLEAGIRVWVITGDKRETAINIGFACSLLASDMKLMTIDGDSRDDIMQQLDRAERIAVAEPKVALVVTGSSLTVLLEDNTVKRFVSLSSHASSVVCCRVSPLQKALVVRSIRKLTGSTALAIGDGANDVGMILEADVGVGLSGREGRQAVLASDYSFSQFRFLKRLLLFHGRVNFYRNAELIFYSFYKNMAMALCQIFYGAFSHFGGGTVFDSVLFMAYNVVFTCVPPVVYAGLERDVSPESMLQYPALYKLDGRKKSIQGWWAFIKSQLFGAAHSAVCFFVPFLICGRNTMPLEEFGTTVYTSIVFVANIRIMAMSYYWTWFHWFFYIFSALIAFPAVWIIDALKLSKDMRGFSSIILSDPRFYLCVITATMFCGIPMILIEAIRRGKDTLTNMVMLNERKPRCYDRKRSGSIRLTNVKHQHDSVPVMHDTNYIDQNNVSGFAFSPPMTLNTTISPRSFHTNRTEFNSLPAVPRGVSTFALDF